MIFNIIIFAVIILLLAAVVYLYLTLKHIEMKLELLRGSTGMAFSGYYVKLARVEDKLDNHCHHYEFEDGTLYIKEPIFMESSSTFVQETDEVEA